MENDNRKAAAICLLFLFTAYVIVLFFPNPLLFTGLILFTVLLVIIADAEEKHTERKQKRWNEQKQRSEEIKRDFDQKMKAIRDEKSKSELHKLDQIKDRL